MSLPPEPPGSTLFIFALAVTINFAMTLANRLLTNPEQMKAWRKEVTEWYTQLREAQKSGNKKQIEKLMKKQQYIMQLNAKASWQTMKVSILFFAPLAIVWSFLGGIYGGANIAYFPGVGWHLPIPLFGSSLFWWYMLCSLFSHAIFSHLFGLLPVE